MALNKLSPLSKPKNQLLPPPPKPKKKHKAVPPPPKPIPSGDDRGNDNR
ncbi:hypothetical protein OK074_3424 [Actinobacteria bacterium OK074]|nr:hypothetical protein OK074_3424 [Actinobacteria bacterium OK074]